MTQAWHTTSVARALLAGCASNAPVLYRNRHPYVLTTDEWLTYDEADPRVVKLAQIQSFHAAAHLASEEACRDGRTKLALGCTVDQAIDAVQDQPRIFNLNDPEQRARRDAIRADIFGERGGLAA